MKVTYTELGKDCGLYNKPTGCGKFRRNKYGCKLCRNLGDWKRSARSLLSAAQHMSFHHRHCAEDGDCPLRATCEVKNFPDGHERKGCRIEEFAEGPEGGYKVHLMNEKSLAIARAIVNRTTDPPCPGDCDVCNKLGCSERREEPKWIE